MNEYDPSLPDAAVLAKPDGPLSVTVAPGTTAPVSSITWPRNAAVCAQRGRDRTIRANGKREVFILYSEPAAIGGAARGRISVDSIKRRHALRRGYGNRCSSPRMGGYWKDK